MKKTLITLSALALTALLTPTNAHAFKWSKCKGVYKSWGVTESKSNNLGRILMDYLAQLTSQATSQSSTSTTSFVSSTGKCAAFAKAETERLNYVAQTMTEIKLESAEGQGEHIEALATLYGCNPAAQKHFSSLLKENHKQIFSGSQGAEVVTEKITGEVANSKILQNACNLELI